MATVRLPSGNILEVHDYLYNFVREEAIAGTAWTADGVFEVLGELIEEFGPPNRELLARRADVQQKVDDYYLEKRRNGWVPTEESAARDSGELERFLVEIGYLDAERPVDFEVATPQLDPEMDLNGPELVTPVTNASMAVGGANARWGSLYDAWFLSDIRSEIDPEDQRPARLRMVVEDTNAFLDEHVTAWQGGVSFDSIKAYSVNRKDDGAYELVGQTSGGDEVRLEHPEKFIGFNLDDEGELSEFLLADNGLRIQFQLYEGGAVDPVNGQFRDLVVESALTNIVDFEDAVAVVDAGDLVEGLRNYLGLIRGSLVGYGSRGNLKQLNSDRAYLDVNGEERKLKTTSLISVRNVSLHMYTGAVTLGGEEVPERIVGVLLTTLIASAHDRGSNGEPREDGEGVMPVRGPNSGRGFVYQVTPKLHTAAEVAEQMRFFEAVERGLGDSAAAPVSRGSLLTFPLLRESKLKVSGVREDAVLRYTHSMVAYVEPWVRRGIGCSGVPNFDQIEEMKDRATERIDGAILANWRLHGVISPDDIEDAVRKAAEIVDQQSAGVSGYVPMADTREKQDTMLGEPALAAVLEIIDDALSSPSAYVEPALFRNRRSVKAG